MPAGKLIRVKPRRRKRSYVNRKAIRREILKMKETKQISTNWNTVSVTSSAGGTPRTFNTVVNDGDAKDERDGQQIRYKSLYAKLTAFTDDTNQHIIRVIVARNKGDYSATPMTYEVADVVDFDKYHVYYDHQVLCTPENGHTFTIKVPLKNRLGIFDGTTGADCMANSQIFMYIVSGSASANQIYITGNSSLYFKDN